MPGLSSNTSFLTVDGDVFSRMNPHMLENEQVAMIEKLRSFDGAAFAAFWISHFEFPAMPPIEALKTAPSRCKNIEKNGPHGRMAVSWQ